MRYAIELARIPEHERRYLEHEPELAAQVLPEAPELIEHEDHLVRFYFGERSATPSEYPLDKLRVLSLYERLYGEVDAFRFVDQLQAMESEFFASRATQTPQPPDKEPTE